MTLKQRLQHWLGIDQVLWNLQDIRDNRSSDRKLLNTMDENIRDAVNSIRGTNALASNTLTGVSRLIAKADATYGADEFSAARRAESDRLGEEVEKRLIAEAKARAPYNE